MRVDQSDPLPAPKSAPKPALGLPERRVLSGAYARLEPLSEARHGADLASVLQGADAVWNYMTAGPFASEAALRAWLRAREGHADPLFHAVLDAATGKALGGISLMRIDQPNGVIEVGSVFFSPALQRTRIATEALYLLARHVFEDVRYRRLEWKCNDENKASKNAALRFGFSYEGVFRQHMIVKHRNRDTAWFAMLDRDWPARKAAFERWLHPDNFDERGVQRQSLSALNGIGAS